MKFRLKLFIVLLVVSIIPIFLVGIISYYDNQRTITEHTLNNLEFFIEKEKKNITNTINFHSERLNFISNRAEILQTIQDYKKPSADVNREKIDEVLEIIKNVVGNAEKISIIGVDGTVLTSTKISEINQEQAYEKFEEIKNSDQITIDYILTNEGRPVILFSKGLILNESMIGVIFVEFQPESIFGQINVNALGRTGEFVIAKKTQENKALLIYPLIIEEDTILQKTISMERQNIPIVQALLNNQNSFLNLVNDNDEPILAATGYIEEVGWGMVANISKSEIFSSLQFSVLILIFVIAAISIAVVIISILLSQTIARPIKEMVNVSDQITRGNLNVRSKINTKDELNILSNSLNDMIESLEKKIKIEAELEDSKNQLRNERIKTIGMLASQIAHDIKNPLYIIKNSIEIIRKKNPENKIIIREINRANRGIARISHQVEDVLNYVNPTQTRFIPGSLLKIIQSTMDTVKIPEKVEVILPKKDILVECDAEKMESVFNNIILNAIHAIGNTVGKITIRLMQDKDNAIIEFENTGPNIEENVLPKIFEPLFSTKEKGTGLGLVSCKNIIETHGGNISVRSNPVIFKIKIPLKHENTKKT
ncbi:ATP-binding protein [Nitrosopumilus sp.]|uniref:sensor histidine kinase n=1 Tax=Nitrosopumilus sp. TaxID=2024843 RepID=UPI003B59EC0D